MNRLSKRLVSIGMSGLVIVTAAAQAETKITLAHVANTEDAVHAAAITFARVAKEESGGEINVRVFPNSQLGKGKEVLEGPVVPGIDQGDVVTNQDDVDDLLSSLGF